MPPSVPHSIIGNDSQTYQYNFPSISKMLSEQTERNAPRKHKHELNTEQIIKQREVRNKVRKKGMKIKK
jgi:hypothetical protein